MPADSDSGSSASYLVGRTVVALLIIMSGLVGTSSTASGVAGFGDVEHDRFYTHAVQWMVDNHITTGTSPACFAPEAPTTRGQAAAFMWRMEGEPTPLAAHGFDDITASWQGQPVSWMYERHISIGTSPRTFSPERTLTRGELAVLLWRLAGEPTPRGPDPFVDVTRTWQRDAVAWMHEKGITTGTSPTEFSPDGSVTRGQVATFLHRYKGEPAVTVDPASPRCAAAPTTTTEPPPRPPSALRVTDVAPDLGIAAATHTQGENCVADLDGDGLRDLILSNHADAAWPIYRGLAGGGLAIDDTVFPRRDRHGCAVADFNNDGLADIYMSIGACRGTCGGAKELWIQQSDHSFSDRADEWGVADPLTRGRVPIVVDANGDDLPDLYAGAAVGVDDPSPNRLWINRGTHFEMHEGPPSIETGTNCADAGDIDGDGLDEIAVCSPDQGFFLYRNLGGRYVDDTESFGLDRHGRRSVELVDLNADGRLDIAWVAEHAVEVLLNTRGRFELVYRETLTDGVDLAFGDVDNDGDLDMYVQQGANTGDPDTVRLNSGIGHFVPGPELPETTGNTGDTVVSIPDWNETGRAAFLVNNGRLEDEPRPRQLFEFSID